MNDKINEVYGYFSQSDDGEKIILLQGMKGEIPLVAFDNECKNLFAPVAQKFADQSGKCVKFVRFTRAEELETLTPTPPI